MDFCNEMQMDFIFRKKKGELAVLNIVRRSRETVIKHIMLRACEDQITGDQALRLIAAFQQEYELANDSIERYQRACYQLTESCTIILEPLVV
jgi:hypothetical protein